MAFGLSAGAATLLGSVAAPVIGGLLGGSKSEGGGPTNQTTQNQLDPRITAMLFGGDKTLKAGATATGTDENGRPIYADSDYTPASQGLLSRYQGLLDKSQNTGLQSFGDYNNAYLSRDMPYDMGQIRNTSWALANSDGNAPQIQAAQGGYTNGYNTAQSAYPGGNQGPHMSMGNSANVSLTNAPSQNGMNLNPALNDVIYGELGNNPFLTGAIQKGLNQSEAQFGRLQDSMTKNFKESVLPSLRSEAIANGGYGGSRQGIAEGKAADSFATQLSQAISQVGQNNTDAAVQAQAAAYNQDRTNQLNASMGLSNQQYNTAGQDAGYKNQNSLANANMLNQNNQFNAGVGNNYLSQMLNNNQFNANAQNQAMSQRYTGDQAMNLANLGYKQNTNQFNAGNTMDMARLNSSNKATGTGLISGLANQQYGYANNQNDYALNQANKVNGLLSPWMNANSTQTINSTTPIYQNQASGALGGALAGSQLYKNIMGGYGVGSGGSNSSTNPFWTNLPNDQGFSGYPIGQTAGGV